MSRLALVKTTQVVVWLMIAYALWWRFQWAFVHSPLDYLFSDPGRHYENGHRLFNPTFTGSVDPFLYQLYVWLVIKITHQQAWIINTLTGLLAASMPWCWYLFLKELMPRFWAQLGCLIIAITPSLAIIYGYFMNETLLLNLLGIAFWLTWRSLRLQTVGSFTFAAFIWALASITRVVALPMAAACLAYLIWRQGDYVKRGGIVLILYVLVSIWPAIHAHKMLHVYTPFGFPLMNTIYARSGAKGIHFTTENPSAFYEFSAPSLYGPPHMTPLNEWRNPREGTFTFHIDLAKGKTDWEKALKKAEEHPYGVFNQIRENILTLFFHGGWPDSTEKRDYNLYLYINWLSRWMWAPLIVLIPVLFYSAYRKGLPRDARFFILLTLIMVGLLCIQQTGVMEGRFRKPLEPMILVSVVMLWHRLWTNHSPDDKKCL